MYLSPSIQLSFMTAISPFWSVPLTPPPPGSSLKAYGHYEMLAPTFFVLFTVLPLLASLLFFEFVRDYNVHRHTARRVLAVSALLRRKSPHFKSIPGLQWVRDFCYGELLFIAFLVIGNVVLFVYGWINQRRVPLAQAILQHVFLVLAIRELALLEEISPVLAKIRHLDPQGTRFTLRFNLTRMPSTLVLDTPIEHERLRGKSSIVHNGADVQTGMFAGLRRAPAPFIEPLRSRGTKVVLYTGMFLPVTLLILWLEFDNGVLMDHGNKTQYWPLQNFVEISVVFLTPIVAYTLLLLNRWRRSFQSHSLKNGHNDAHCNYSSVRSTADTQDVVDRNTGLKTLRDLVEEYDVACGSRPNMMQILGEVYARHNATSATTTIGVFLSGPQALKAATDDAIADLGYNDFDVHEEEFEL
ncbi:hypothetical protein PR001_g5183 [Phytophthora rubi]|uniref:FAD-binding FR-type domain-containing protein n=1 Tax=Phytophthora rubi TaxID=129364 RepID=A0A6A3NHD2_9STRA|nr:hypothetical protein PR001_g5183 [Phytophthora rubi]